MQPVVVALAVSVPPAVTAIVLWTRRRRGRGWNPWFLPGQIANPMRDQLMLALQTALHAEQDRHMRIASVFGLTTWIACCWTLVGRAYSAAESSMDAAEMAPVPAICFAAGLFAMRPTDRTTTCVVVFGAVSVLACISYEVSGTSTSTPQSNPTYLLEAHLCLRPTGIVATPGWAGPVRRRAGSANRVAHHALDAAPAHLLRDHPSVAACPRARGLWSG